MQLTADPTQTKKCKSCGETKPVERFSKQRGVKDGLRSRCKDCLNQQGRESMVAYRDRNRERRNEQSREYHRTNAEVLKEKRQQRYKDNPDKYRIASKECAKRNPETRRVWRKNNTDKIKVYWHKRRAEKIKAGGHYTTKDIASLLSRQKGKCPICKTSILKKYHIDHIMPLALGGNNYISNIQLLCPSCNLSKGAKHPIEFMQSLGFLL